jgi:hypothetical protein
MKPFKHSRPTILKSHYSFLEQGYGVRHILMPLHGFGMTSMNGLIGDWGILSSFSQQVYVVDIGIACMHAW